LVVLLVAVGGAVAVAPAVGAVGAGSASSADEASVADDQTVDAGNASMGAQLSSFMQASTAEANGSVDSGMWEARFEQSNASDRARVVRNRAVTLEQRHERLRERMSAVQADYENGSLPEPVYVARASRLNSELATLEDAINDTADAAESSGVDTSRLADLRENAGNLTGKAVAKRARNLSVANPPGVEMPGKPPHAGGPDDAGPPEDRGNDQNPADGQQSKDRSNDSETENDDTGPPDDRGPPDDKGAGEDGDDSSGAPTNDGGPAGGSNDGGDNGPPR
jgi:hypothetical protein